MNDKKSIYQFKLTEGYTSRHPSKRNEIYIMIKATTKKNEKLFELKLMSIWNVGRQGKFWSKLMQHMVYNSIRILRTCFLYDSFVIYYFLLCCVIFRSHKQKFTTSDKTGAFIFFFSLLSFSFLISFFSYCIEATDWYSSDEVNLWFLFFEKHNIKVFGRRITFRFVNH